METADRYLRFVLWSEEDHAYVGYCPDLFPWGGVCHATSEQEAYSALSQLVSEEVEDLRQSGQDLPRPSTRVMREAIPM